jgi:predicted flap endonuclease-1-like 5' DNA nuclease/tetrahydromethanopterin S-methyltransferase subunit B
MLALISQILMCLLAAAVVGFVTAWFLRRRQADELAVEIERLRQGNGGVNYGPLEKKIDALGTLQTSLGSLSAQVSSLKLPQADFSGLEKRIDGLPRNDLAPLQASLDEVKKLLARPAGSVDLSVFDKRFDSLAATLTELQKRPAGAAAATVDLSPLTKRQDALQAAIDELKNRPAPKMPELNVSGLEKKIDALSGGHGDLTSKLTLVTSAVSAFRSTDVSGLEKKVELLSNQVEALKNRPAPVTPEVNLAPIEARQDKLQVAIEELKKAIPAPQKVDLQPTEKRLDVLAQAVEELKNRPAPKYPEVNLGALEKRLDTLHSGHGDLTSQVALVSTAVSAIRATDVSPLEKRIDALSAHVEELKKRPAPTVPTVDLAPLQKRIDSVSAVVDELKARPVPHFPAVDFGPLVKRHEALAQAVDELKNRPAPKMPDINLNHVEKKLDVLTGGHGDLTSKLAAVSSAVSALRPADFSALEKRVELVTAAVEELRKRPQPQLPDVDLSAVYKRLDGVSAAVEELKKRPQPQLPDVDLSAVYKRLDGVNAAVEELKKRPQPHIPEVNLTPLEKKIDALQAGHGDFTIKLGAVTSTVAALRSTDVSGLEKRIESLNATVAELQKRPAPTLPELDLSAVYKRLDAVSVAVDELKKRPLQPLPDLDLTSVYKRQDALQSAMEGLKQSMPKVEKVDLSGLEQKLTSLAAEVAELKKRPVPQLSVDWKHVDTRFESLEKALATVRAAKPETAASDAELSALTARFSRFEQHLSSFKAPAATDLEPVFKAIGALEEEVKRLGLRLHQQVSLTRVERAPTVKKVTVRKPPKPARKEVKDDLILIHGVGPVLQRMLNKLGVYRFEQVMRWTQKDIDEMTSKLPNFKGRIEREGWVASARDEYRKKYGKS